MDTYFVEKESGLASLGFLRSDSQVWYFLRSFLGYMFSICGYMSAICAACTEESESIPQGCRNLRRAIYIEDIFSGGDSVSQAIAKREELYLLLQTVDMSLRNWTANDFSLLQGKSSSTEDVPVELDEILSPALTTCLSAQALQIERTIAQRSLQNTSLLIICYCRSQNLDIDLTVLVKSCWQLISHMRNSFQSRQK